MDFVHILEIIAMVLALMLAIIGHEIMHGYVAHRYGDNTAKYEGRLSINPLVHVDLVGTIIVPAVLFLAMLRLCLDGRNLFLFTFLP